MDGAVFGGYVKPANLREDRKDRRFRQRPCGKRQWVVVARNRVGETLTGVFRSEYHALAWVKHRVVRSTVLHADEASSWHDLHAHFEMKRINHEQAYSFAGGCTNWAESFFGPMRRGEIGYHHRIAGPYLPRYAHEAAWREDNRRLGNRERVERVATLALNCKPSIDFCGYWQRHAAH